MAIAPPTLHFIASLDANLNSGEYEGEIYRWIKIRFSEAKGDMDEITIHFDPPALDKFTMLAEAIQRIFGDKTQEKTNV